jgi:hypothetical protein
MKTIKSQIMTTAWQLAKLSAKKFGGKSSQYLSESLKLVWKKLTKKVFIRSENIINKVEFDRVIDATKSYSHGTTGFGGFDLTMYQFTVANKLGLLRDKSSWV